MKWCLIAGVLVWVSSSVYGQNYGSYGESSESDYGTYDESILDDSPFAGFKQNVVETECTVPRIGEFPAYGDTKIGNEGGVRVRDEEAITAYECAKPAMREGYSKADYPYAQNFLDWSRFSTGPYLSKAHSKRYVFNYANKIAAEEYGKFEQGGTLAVGSVLAKDSFVVTESGRVVFGALSLMEKMPKGFNPEIGDWRFTMILPDGRLFGSTGDVDSYTVKFCGECHLDAGAENDYLFFLPERYRPK